MRSAGSSLLLLLGVAFALWSPLLSFPNKFKQYCGTIPDESQRCGQAEERFFYNFISRRCELFTDFGCPMRHYNNYATLEQCKRSCVNTQFPGLQPLCPDGNKFPHHFGQH